MYKALSFPSDICNACGEALSHCWAPLLPGAKYGMQAACSIQTEQWGNQTDLALPYYGVLPLRHTRLLPKVRQMRAAAGVKMARYNCMWDTKISRHS